MDAALENSVVAIFAGDAFQGSAFFLSPKHILTAKHVLFTDEGQQLKSNLQIGLAQGEDRIPVRFEHIISHPDDECDVALITLSPGVKDQTHGSIAKIREGVTGESVDCCGINHETKTRSPRNGKTLTAPDRASNAYIIDHQVLKGYSGGLMASGDALIGIVVRRHKQDQSSKALSLWDLKSWLTEKIGHDQPSGTLEGENCPLAEFCVFVDRPKRTREAIVESVQKQPIGGFVCVAESLDKHNPPDFGRHLLMRISVLGADNEHKQLFYALKQDRFDAALLAGIDLRVIQTGDEFCRGVDHAIYEKLFGGPKNVAQEMSEADKRLAIVELMRSGKTPRMFMVKKYLEATSFFRKIRGHSQIKEVDTLLTWIRKWNAIWAESLTEWKKREMEKMKAHNDLRIPPLMILLIVDADKSTVETLQVGAKGEATASIPLPLTKIAREDFDQWLAHGSQLLQVAAQGRGENIDRLVNTAERKLLDGIEAEQEGFPIYYKRFENISHVLNPQKEMNP